MIRIRFPDPASEHQALGYLPGRFTFKSWSNGTTLVPDFALQALMREGIPFIVEGPATYQQMLPPIRYRPSFTN